jgi:hypothetical protein
MIREAERADLHFDPVKLRALNCCPEDQDQIERDPMPSQSRRGTVVPEIEIITASPSIEHVPEFDRGGLPGPVYRTTKERKGKADGGEPTMSKFENAIHSSAISGHIHDVLTFSPATSRLSTIAWNIMEYLPFRRMDLQPDGSWKSITWPLPKGEVRDVPDDVVVHGSVLRRLKHDEDYRPGNLIVGGGGRGVRYAPEDYGIGSWKLLREEGNPVGECWVRAEKAKRVETESKGVTTPIAPLGAMAYPTTV